MQDFTARGATILLAYVVVPVWLAAGLADYFCHRAAHIERTSGTPESVLHLAQFGLVGFPLLLALFFRIDAGELLAIAAFAAAHHAAAYIDLRYETGRREITPIEQMDGVALADGTQFRSDDRTRNWFVLSNTTQTIDVYFDRSYGCCYLRPDSLSRRALTLHSLAFCNVTKQLSFATTETIQR